MKKLSHNNAILALLLAALLLCGCSQEAPKHPGMPPAAVTTVQPIQKDVPVFIEAIGNVFANISADIRPQVSGKIIEVNVKEGQFVKKGDLLFTIDPRPSEASLALAEATLSKDKATLTYAQKKMQRNKELVTKEFISQLSYEELESNVAVDEAQIQIDLANVELAKINRDYCYVKAPIDGRLGNLRIELGNVVTANDPNPVINVSQIDPAIVQFKVPQNQLWEIQNAKSAGTLSFSATLPQDPDKPMKGDLYFIDNMIDLGTGTVLLKGSIPNANYKLWPGEFVRVTVNLKTKKNAILLPSQAIERGPKGHFVYVVKPDNTVEMRNIATGEIVDNMIVIESGLAMGETVVLTGQLNLRPGAAVFIHNPEETPPKAEEKKSS